MNAVEAIERDLQDAWNMYHATARIIAQSEWDGTSDADRQRRLAGAGGRVNASRAALGYVLGCCTYQNLCSQHNGTSDLAKHSHGDKALANRLLYGNPVSAQ